MNVLSVRYMMVESKLFCSHNESYNTMRDSLIGVSCECGKGRIYGLRGVVLGFFARGPFAPGEVTAGAPLGVATDPTTAMLVPPDIG